MKGYNYDMAEGIDYTIDISQEIGNRIGEIILSISGDKLDFNKKYKVAMNSYRAMGGGGHISAAHSQENDILFKSNKEMRNILAEYIRKIELIGAEIDNNWKVINPD